MKKIFIILWLAVLGGSLTAQTNQPLEVVVNKVKSEEGTLMVALFNSEKTFTAQPWKGEKSKAQSGTMKIVFHDIPSGQYVVAVYHDANENGKMDSNFMGIPKEGFGFSNDAMGTFGPPSYEKALIHWTGAETFTINLKYY